MELYEGILHEICFVLHYMFPFSDPVRSSKKKLLGGLIVLKFNGKTEFPRRRFDMIFRKIFTSQKTACLGDIYCLFTARL